MNKGLDDLKSYIEVFVGKYACFTHADLFLAPVTASLGTASELLRDSCVHLGAQNMFFEEAGAYTGETSPALLEELGCRYALIGHSERRKYFHETNEDTNKKVRAAIENGIRPILCVGEDLRTNELGIAKERIKIQIIE